MWDFYLNGENTVGRHVSALLLYPLLPLKCGCYCWSLSSHFGTRGNWKGKSSIKGGRVEIQPMCLITVNYQPVPDYLMLALYCMGKKQTSTFLKFTVILGVLSYGAKGDLFVEFQNCADDS